jgi:hypothetical protein
MAVVAARLVPLSTIDSFNRSMAVRNSVGKVPAPAAPPSALAPPRSRTVVESQSSRSV